MFFGSFSRLVNFFVVPLQLANILMVAAIFRLRKRNGPPDGYRTPGFPVTPLIYIVVMAGFLVSAMLYQPVDTLIGVALAPEFIFKQKKRRADDAPGEIPSQSRPTADNRQSV